MKDKVKELHHSRLALRIRWLLVALAGIMAGLFGTGGLLLLIDAEDAIQDTYLAPLSQQIAYAPKGSDLPRGIRRYHSPSEISADFGLADVPEKKGLYEFFADEEGKNAIAPKNFAERLRLWSRDDREREFRMWFEPATADRDAAWVLVDLGDSEFSDVNLSKVYWHLVLLASSILLAALLTSRIIANWALRPIMHLAERVRGWESDLVASRYRESPLSTGLPKDEFGYLAKVLDEYHKNLRITLERERLFIADCSHELRTPITTINGAIVLLRDFASDATAHERVLKRLERTGRRMERLIQTFLMIARENRLPLPTEEIDLREVIREVVDEWRSLQLEHPLIVIFEKCQCIRLRCDREGIAVIVHNLVGNAYRHLRGGRLEIEASNNDEGFAVLSFKDDGPGLPEFSQSASAYKEAQPINGYGLGLSLVGRLCNMQGWVMEKNSRKEGGTVIQITIIMEKRNESLVSKVSSYRNCDMHLLHTR
jgi:signal transduction histidine kinase